MAIVTPTPKTIILPSEYSGNLTPTRLQQARDFTLPPLYKDGFQFDDTKKASEREYNDEWLEFVPGSVNDYAVNLDAYWEAIKTYFWYFSQEFVKIKSKGSKMIPFVLNRPQQLIEKVILEETIRRGRAHLWILKPRQIGMSLYFANRALWAALFYDMNAVIFASKKEEHARQLIFPYAYHTLKGLQFLAKRGGFPYPELLELKIDKPSGGELAFADIMFDGQAITGRGSLTIKQAENSAVGFSCPYGHLTEASRVRDYGAFIDAFKPSIPPEPYPSYLFVESTAHHGGQFFYNSWDRYNKEYEQWLRGECDYPAYRAVFVPAYLMSDYRIPDYILERDKYDWDRFNREKDPELYGEDEEELIEHEWYDPLSEKSEKLDLGVWLWRRRMIKSQEIPPGTPFTQRQIFDQNYPFRSDDALLQAGRSVFPRDIIIRRKSMCIPAPWKGEVYVKPEAEGETVFEERAKGKFMIWDRPRPQKVYILGADIAGGTFGDYHVGHVWYPGAKLLVATYRSNDESREDFLIKMMAFGRYYNIALFVPESNYYGREIQMILTDRGRHHYPGAPYPNIYRRTQNEDVPWEEPTYNVGVHSTVSGKNYGQTLLLQRFRDFDRFDEYGSRVYCGSHIPYEEIFTEALTWERQLKKDGSGEYIEKTPHHSKGNHDDTLSAYMCCLIGEEFLYGKYSEDVPRRFEMEQPDWVYDFVKKQTSGMPVADIGQDEIEELLNLNSNNFGLNKYDDRPMFRD